MIPRFTYTQRFDIIAMHMEPKGEKTGAGPFKPGDRFGDCTVERLLGKGGLGFVYLVRGSDGERYALKTLRTD